MTKIYKIMTRQQWQQTQDDGIFKGAEVDLKDGFIHFSTAEQVEETARKHFKGQKGLMLITCEGDDFDDTLKWEVSRGGAEFPHLYDVLPLNKMFEVNMLEDRADGSHDFTGIL